MTRRTVTQHDIATIVAGLADLDPRLKRTPATLTVWADNLMGRDYGDVMEAIRQWTRGAHDDPPRPGIIRRMAISVTESRLARDASRMIRPSASTSGAPSWFRAWRDAGADPAALELYRSGAYLHGQQPAADYPDEQHEHPGHADTA